MGLKLFNMKDIILYSCIIVIVNLYLFYSLSQGFFSNPVRYYLFILISQIYFIILIGFIYFYARFKKMNEDYEELLLIIKNVQKINRKSRENKKTQ